MVFSSLLFLCGFLPVFLVLYFIAPARWKNAVALGASCIFYSWSAAGSFAILGIGLLVDYVITEAIAKSSTEDPQSVRRRKLLLALSIAANVGALGYYKYSNFFIQQVNAALAGLSLPELRWAAVILPVGISFFTFHKISYVVDVYRKTSPPAKSFATFALYVLFFPQLIAGPIIRYHDVAAQFVSRTHTAHLFSYGAFRFCMGLGKKVLIANQLAITADILFGQQPEHVSTLHAWIGILCYTFQIYFDFSGYSDMALGLGCMLGIRFKENFDCPYRSLSITEFWRRWHISLSSWMKEYLYVPLGGNRVGTGRMYFNLWIVFLISGLWHGASFTFVVWGIYHGTFLVLEKLFGLRILERLPKLARASMTFLIVLVGWVFFRSPDLGYAIEFLGRMAALTQYTATQTSLLTAELLSNRSAAALVLAAALSFAPLSELGQAASRSFESPLSSLPGAILRYSGALLCLGFSFAALFNSGYNPFIYFRF